MITVGGENLIDYVQTGLDGGLPIFTAVPGGSCYNVAIAIARQNQPVTYVTPISKDNLGNILAERLIADEVSLGTARIDAPTSLARWPAQLPILSDRNSRETNYSTALERSHS